MYLYCFKIFDIYECISFSYFVVDDLPENYDDVITVPQFSMIKQVWDSIKYFYIVKCHVNMRTIFMLLVIYNNISGC